MELMGNKGENDTRDGTVYRFLRRRDDVMHNRGGQFDWVRIILFDKIGI